MAANEDEGGIDEAEPEPEPGSAGPAPERALEVFGRGVRTALRNNATAYGFSISITTAYGLVTGAQGPSGAVDTIAFAVGAAVAFVVIGAVFVAASPAGSLGESGQVATISGGIDLLAVIAAVAAAFGLSRLTSFWAWPLTGVGTVLAYLLVGGLDILVARSAARHTSFGSAQ